MLLHKRVLTTGDIVELHKNDCGCSVAVWLANQLTVFPATSRETAEQQFNAAVAEIYRQTDAPN